MTEVITHSSWGHSRLPNETAFNLAYSTDKTFFEFMQQPKNIQRGRRLGMSLKATEGFAAPRAILEGSQPHA